MRVILVEDVERLGKRGTVVNVADGYGRNFLIPRKLAVAATEGNLKSFETQKQRAKVTETREATDAHGMKTELEKLSFTIPMKAGEGDILFGAVTASHIADVIEREGFTIDKRRIDLEEPIKRIGEYIVPVKLFKNITASVKVSVVKE